jgi:hypothetical protein
MRTYVKVFGPLDQSFVASFSQEGADKLYTMKSAPGGQSRKAVWIANYNFFTGYGVPNQTALVWYQIDTTTGTPPGGGVIVSQWSGTQLATGIYPLTAYSQHPLN